VSEYAAILLAAGNSSRMGAPKQLLDFRGKHLVRYVAEALQAAGCDPVVVVVGAYEHEVRAALTGLPVEIVVNERWPEGMGTSIQAGLRALQTDLPALEEQNINNGVTVKGAILALADQPFVTPEFLRGLIAKHRVSGKRIVAAQYSGTAGVPVFFACEAFPLLMALKPEQGCKGVILGHPAEAVLIDCPEAAMDIDTPEDYRRATLDAA
jgi:molybdenum cofactor cytidylyltransferase